MLRYGLKRNPFGIGQPPKYKEEGWCFVDLKLEDGTYASQRIEDFVRRIAGGHPGRRGVLIVGHWGSGKTHMLRQLLGRAKEEGLETIEVYGRVKTGKSGVEDLMKDLLGSNDIDKIIENLLNKKRLVGIDEAQFFDQFAGKPEKFIELMENFRLIVEELSKNAAKAGLALCITPGPLEVLHRHRPDIPDRFEILRLKEDLSEQEAIELVVSYLKTARDKNWVSNLENSERKYVESLKDPTRLNLWPFTIGAVRSILEFWNTESLGKIRKLRRFLDLCRDVLDYAMRKNLNEILPPDVKECLIKYHDLWKECLEEWKASGIRKHKILVHGLYKAIDLARMSDTEIRIDGVYPELTLQVSSGSVRPDIIVQSEDKFIIIEVETGKHVSTERYRKVYEAINEGYASGILIVCTNHNALMSAKRTSYRVSKGKSFDVILLKVNDDLESILTSGRIIAFASASLEGFPSDENLRQELRMALSGSEAADALRISGIADKIAMLR